jgi:CHAD domain-containing protein
MNFDTPPSATEPGSSLQPEWQRPLEAWCDLLAQCARKPSRKRVHALRRLTLRLRAAMQHGLRDQARNSPAVRALKRWEKAGKRLRKTLGPVRDIDVFLSRLVDLRDSSSHVLDHKPHLGQRCLREIDKLQTRLENERQSGAKELMKVLAARSKRLNRRSQEIEDSAPPRMSPMEHSTADAALEIFAGITADFPVIDDTNLHAYRKRLKHALYLAEISAPADPVAKRLSAAFRKIHSAAGEWHDWQTLAGEARRILPSHGKQDGLVPVLEGLAQGALKKAVGLCRRSAAQFLTKDGKIRPLQK